MTARRYTAWDRGLIRLEAVLAACAGVHDPAQRPYPADDLPEPVLDDAERRHSAGLMRVDHAGEVCAQGLYEGQAAGARSAQVAEHMRDAAQEEADHLAWSQQRLSELESHTSYLNPVWYLSSFLLGYIAAQCGDRWSLGFVVETERQVEGHLQTHLAALPDADAKSRVVLQTMMADEIAHAAQAERGGAAALPQPIPMLMQSTAKIMTTLSYWL